MSTASDLMDKSVGMRCSSWLIALALVGAPGGSCARRPEVALVDCNLVGVDVVTRTRIDPLPVAVLSYVAFAVEAPESTRPLVKHGAGGQLRVAPAGPYYVLTSVVRDENADGRPRCTLELKLDGSECRMTAETLVRMLDKKQVLEVQLQIFDESLVVAESGWMDASALLASVADRLR